MSFQLWNDDNDVVSTLDDTHDFCSKHVRLLKIFFSLSAIFPFRFSFYSFLAVFLRRVHVILHTYFTLLLLSLVRRFLSVSYTHREREWTTFSCSRYARLWKSVRFENFSHFLHYIIWVELYAFFYSTLVLPPSRCVCLFFLHFDLFQRFFILNWNLERSSA